ncbi:hypothetical protein [Achromobacter marplatensis]
MGETPRKGLKHCLFWRLRQQIIKYYRYIIFYFLSKNAHKLVRVFWRAKRPSARRDALHRLPCTCDKSMADMGFFIFRRHEMKRGEPWEAAGKQAIVAIYGLTLKLGCNPFIWHQY